MDTNTTSEQLHDLIESLYPDTVDAHVASQFNIKQRALACPANLVELRKMYCIMVVVPSN